MTGKPVLIVTYAFPPHCRSLGGAIRALKLAEHLQDRGFDVTVLCARSTHFDTFGYDALLARLRVQCVDDPMARWASRVISGPGGAGAGKGAVSRPAGWRQGVKRLALDALTPDTAVTILGAFKRAARDWARAHPEGTVITSGPPHSVHLAGRWLRRQFPALRWLVDYRDSWNGTVLFRKRQPWLQKLNLRLEARVLRECDALTYISPPMLAKVLPLGPADLSAKAHLVTNGFDADLPALLQGAPRSEGALRVGYFGAVDDGADSYRSPACLFEAALARPDLPLRIEFYGPVQISQTWQQRLGERLLIGGKLPHEQALQKMAGMDVLLLLHTREDGADEVVTGKVFEYIATGRPILSIGPAEMAVNGLLDGDPAAFAVSHRDVEGIAALLQRLSAAKAAGTLPHRDASRLVSFTRGHQYRTFERLIERQP